MSLIIYIKNISVRWLDAVCTFIWKSIYQKYNKCVYIFVNFSICIIADIAWLWTQSNWYTHRPIWGEREINKKHIVYFNWMLMQSTKKLNMICKTKNARDKIKLWSQNTFRRIDYWISNGNAWTTPIWQQQQQ